MVNLNISQRVALNETASKLGISSRKLWGLIKFESNFKPGAKNPYSSARGLIQFIDSTARDLGYASSYDLVKKHPTIESQLRTPVYNYLKRYKPFITDQSLFMAVFYPKARYWFPYKLFPYIPVRRDNPGINTPADYMKKVYARLNLTYFPPILILLGIGTVLYITLSERGKRWLKGKRDVPHLPQSEQKQETKKI